MTRGLSPLLMVQWWTMYVASFRYLWSLWCSITGTTTLNNRTAVPRNNSSVYWLSQQPWHKAHSSVLKHMALWWHCTQSPAALSKQYLTADSLYGLSTGSVCPLHSMTHHSSTLQPKLWHPPILCSVPSMGGVLIQASPWLVIQVQ